MNILFITTHLSIGGIAVYTTSLAKALAGRGHRVIVISSGGDMEKELIKEGISHIKLDIRTKSELSPKLWLKLSILASIIRREKPDMIHAQTRVTQVLAAVLAKRFKVPHISTCHGFFKRRLSRRLFGCWGDSVIAISEAVKDHLKRDFGVAQNRIELIHNGVDISRFERGFSKGQIKDTKQSLGLGNRFVIGTVGRLSSVKGINGLISTFGNASFLKEKAKLLIVGNGPEKANLMRTVQSLNIEDKVHFVESNLDTPRLLSVMDVFAFPSVQEGLGLSLIEAMASGRAVVATDVGGIRSLVKNNDTGLLAKRSDRADLARVINRLLDDEEMRIRLGSNAREFVRREYTLEKMVDKTEGLYRRLAK